MDVLHAGAVWIVGDQHEMRGGLGHMGADDAGVLSYAVFDDVFFSRAKIAVYMEHDTGDGCEHDFSLLFVRIDPQAHIRAVIN